MNKRKRFVIVLCSLLSVVVFVSIVAFLMIKPRDPLFRGRPESEWIAGLKYSDEAQVDQWSEFGPEGVRVLVRALEGANRPADRAYRELYRAARHILPGAQVRRLPAPQEDATRVTRATITQLLSRLSPHALLATPIMIRSLRDEDAVVRMCAINFFTAGSTSRTPVATNAPLATMDPETKKSLFPEFMKALQDNNPGVRNNALVTLQYYPEAAPVAVPAVTTALQDPDIMVRRLATNVLKTIDPAAASKAGIQ
jgi:hypothetical protein